MDYRLVAALGGVAIGLVASAVIYAMTVRRVNTDPGRWTVRRWALAFAFSICTFMGGTPLLEPQYIWIVALPLSGIWLALDTLHRIGSGGAGAVS